MTRLLAGRRLLRLLAAAWASVGLIGLYSYLDNYWVTRGFAAVKRDPGVRPGRLEWVNFDSAALGRRADYLIYLPSGYEPLRRYPVFYLLHGMPGRPQAYINIANLNARLDNLIRAGRVPPILLVFPDGRIDGDTLSDSEWANTSAGSYEDYVLDVVRDVDRRFPTIANRDARAIAGYSAGALGALNITLHHPAAFASFEAWSGPFTETRSGVFAHATRAQIARYSPLAYAPRLTPELLRDPVQGFLYGGRSDSDSRRLPEMAAQLQADGAAIQWTFYPGGHDWQLWNAHADQMLILAGRYLTSPPPADHPKGPRPAAEAHRPHHQPHKPRRAPNQAGRRRRPTAAGQTRRPTPGTTRWAAPRTPRRPPTSTRTTHPHHRSGGSPTSTTTTSSTSTTPATTTTPTRIPLATAASMFGVAGQARGPRPGLTLGLSLALLSAAAINLGFLLQQRGLVRDAAHAHGTRELVLRALRSPTWLAGQALGWVGFAVQILAVAIAPLSLVQAFAAGGLVLSVPVAAGIFGHRVSGRQTAAVLLTAAGLASLPLGLPTATDHLATITLILCSAAAFVAATRLGRAKAAASQAIAGGIFYGITDSAIKAVSLAWGAHGPAALGSSWTLLALSGTIGGFLTFQASLRAGDAIAGISLMNTFATLVALLCGLLAFGESLGTSPAAVAAHALAVALVLACVPALAAAQANWRTPSTDTAVRRPDGAAGFAAGLPGLGEPRRHDAAGCE